MATTSVARRLATARPVPARRSKVPPDRYLNRELSWIDFNERVLELAEDPAMPVLERTRFLSIFASNLDEFYQVRVAGLRRQEAAGLGATRSSDGLTAIDQLARIGERTATLALRHARLFLDEVVPALSAAGVRLVRWAELDATQRKALTALFEEHIFPVLTPLSVDPGHPFPYISNLSLNLAIMVRDPQREERRFARVKVPPLLPRFVRTAAGSCFVPLEQVIAAHLDRLFPGMEIELHCPFRVTRNADLSVADEESDDLLATIEMELRRRRFGHAVRLEIQPAMPAEIRDLLVRELDLTPENVYEIDGLLDIDSLWQLYGIDRPDLKDTPWPSVVPPRLAGVEEGTVDIFAVLSEKGVLVQHPYDSFADTVQAFIRQAAVDPHVLAIKQTLYRTSGDSPIVKALIRAAERGKQVAVLVELKARFDEEANIAWARALEQAGVHVVYGLVGLKTHSKTALVVRSEPGGIRRYCHVGTGNYNTSTARLYEDIGLLSADPDLGADLTELFNYLTGYSRQVEYRKLLVAPVNLRERMLELIAGQGHADGRIVMKMNSLVDEEMVDALYAASQAGASIDLIVRGICCLRPGTAGLSENVRVRSIVG